MSWNKYFKTKNNLLTFTFSTIRMEIVLTLTEEIFSTFENSISISSLNAGVFSCVQCSHNQRFRLTQQLLNSPF